MISEERLKTFIGAGLEYTCALEHLMVLVESARVGLEIVIKEVDEGNRQDTKDWIAHNVEKLEVYMDVAHHKLYEIDKMLKRELKE